MKSVIWYPAGADRSRPTRSLATSHAPTRSPTSPRRPASASASWGLAQAFEEPEPEPRAQQMDPRERLEVGRQRPRVEPARAGEERHR